ncbi:MAG TPA: alpha/beta hydrolase [Pyrinomonadaceae bacterium]|jgi:acetyl esterase/lipase|nr:alpha/beta hydrolase [Pyrinomonadaceae bacterium]
MPSLPASFFNNAVRLLIKRRRWGHDEKALVHRARDLFGVPSAFSWLWLRGINVRKVEQNEIRGEWIEPENGDQDAVILYIHGGGFISCSAQTHRPITTGLARRTNFRVFAANYRLAPEHPFPAGLDDLVAAYKWLLAQNISAARIALAGDSAGGNLALGLLLRVRDESLPLPACAVCFSPWTDLTVRDGAGLPDIDRCAMFYPENCEEFASAYLYETSPLERYVSPAFADLSGLPPILFQVSSTELLLDDSRRVHEKIQASGGTSKLEIFDDVFHCWQMLDGFLPEAGAALQGAAEFIKRYTWPDR